MSNDESKKQKILLMGNPNVGKSSLFNILSESYVEVSNYSGTTLETTKTSIGQDIELIDTPGTFNISTDNDEARIAKEALLDLSKDNGYVINVCNILTLDKDLFLTLHLIDLGIPMICIINQIDLAKEKGISVDLDELSKFLGIPIFGVSACTGQGIEELKELIHNDEHKYLFRQGNQSPELLQKLESAKEHTNNLSEIEKLLWLEEEYKDIPSQSICNKKKIYQLRRNRVDRLISHVAKYQTKYSPLLEFLDKFFTHPIFGLIFALFIAWFILYQILGVWVAGILVDFLENDIFSAYINPFIVKCTQIIFPVIEDDLIDISALWVNPTSGLMTSLGTIIAGKYGILTLTLTYLVAVLLPLIWFFYFSWAILEDCGYLPRLSVLADGIMRFIGLNGRGIIPLVLGLGCVTMAMVTTRLLSSRREQLIMMILLSIAVPCSAQLGIIQGLLAKIGGLQSWTIWASIIICILFISGYLANKLIKGSSSPLILDLPPMRLPRITNLLSKANQKTYFFLEESASPFIWAAFVVSLCQVTGLLNTIINVFKPLMVDILHLPADVSLSFLMGMIRRDFGAFGLLDLDLSIIQIITACVSLTLFVPCIATLGIMVKERGWQTAMGIWCLSWILGFGVGGIVTRVLEWPYINQLLF